MGLYVMLVRQVIMARIVPNVPVVEARERAIRESMETVNVLALQIGLGPSVIPAPLGITVQIALECAPNVFLEPAIRD
jgi:hypothetical protein